MLNDQISFPDLEDLPRLKIGALLWSSYINSGAEDLIGDDVTYGASHIWIHNTSGLWFAGLEVDGACRLAGVWKGADDGGISPSELITTSGTLSSFVNPELSVGERTYRIWDFLHTKSLDMKLRLSIEAEDINKLPSVATTSGDALAEHLLGIWKRS